MLPVFLTIINPSLREGKGRVYGLLRIIAVFKPPPNPPP
jgi:hypothetical protein